jgi:hypothetical protein
MQGVMRQDLLDEMTVARLLCHPTRGRWDLLTNRVCTKLGCGFRHQCAAAIPHSLLFQPVRLIALRLKFEKVSIQMKFHMIYEIVQSFVISLPSTKQMAFDLETRRDTSGATMLSNNCYR